MFDLFLVDTGLDQVQHEQHYIQTNGDLQSPVYTTFVLGCARGGYQPCEMLSQMDSERQSALGLREEWQLRTKWRGGNEGLLRLDREWPRSQALARNLW